MAETIDKVIVIVGYLLAFPLGRLSVANGSEITGPFSLAPLDL